MTAMNSTADVKAPEAALAIPRLHQLFRHYSGKELFPSRTKKKASEPEGPEAVIPVISLVALPCGDAETALSE